MRMELECGDLESIAERVTERLIERLRPYLDRAARSGGEKRLYSVSEAAKIIGRGSWALRHMIADGKLPCVRDGKRIFIEKDALESWIAGLQSNN